MDYLNTSPIRKDSLILMKSRFINIVKNLEEGQQGQKSVHSSLEPRCLPTLYRSFEEGAIDVLILCLAK